MSYNGHSALTVTYLYYTLYTVYNMQKFMVPIKYGDLFIQKPISIKDLSRHW